MPVPTFVVAGAARSGTTAVVEALRAMPSVFVTSPKEPHYFAFAGRQVAFQGPGDETVNRAAVTDRGRYLALFDGAGDRHVARGDGSVSTLYYHRHAIDAIHAVNPDMRIVVMLRDPVERAHSSFQYLRSRGYEPLDDFRRALDQEQSRRAANWHHLWHYASMSRYAGQVRAFTDAFGDQVGVWLYEDLETDYAGTVASIAAFVGARAEAAAPAPHGARVNVSGSPRFARVHGAQLWMSRQPGLRTAVKSVVPFAVRERIRSSLLTRGSVADDGRDALRGAFDDDVAALRSLTGRALDEWRS